MKDCLHNTVPIDRHVLDRNFRTKKAKFR